jgi:hypothetical protein
MLLERGKEACEIRGQGRVKVQPFAGRRVREFQPRSVQRLT